MKTTIPQAPPDANPQAGTRKMAGKTNGPESVMTDAPKPKAAAVKDAECKDGVARKCIDTQVGQNGNPKKRDASGWGTGHAAAENEKELK